MDISYATVVFFFNATNDATLESFHKTRESMIQVALHKDE